MVHMTKGQYFSFDAIIASVIFILALFSLLSYWHSLRTALNSQSEDLTREAFRISEMVMTPGYLPGLPCNQMKQLGLAVSWDNKRIDKEKFDCARTLSDSELKTKFFTPYGISIRTVSGASDVHAIGNDITIIATSQIAKVRRIVAILDKNTGLEETIALDVYVYK